MTKWQQAWQVRRNEYEQERQQQRAAVIAEFAGDTDAMAAEILCYRHVLNQLADAIAWAQAGAPFGLIAPGPYWQPKPPHAADSLDGTPAAQ